MPLLDATYDRLNRRPSMRVCCEEGPLWVDSGFGQKRTLASDRYQVFVK